MTPELWLTLLGALGIPVLATSFLNFLNNRRTLAANEPRSDAETDEINTRSQTQIITNQGREIARLGLKADAAEQKAEAVEKRADEREMRMQKQIDAMKKQFAELQVDAEAAHAEAAAARKENEDLRAHNRILTLHVERLTHWAQTNYRDGNANKLGPPPSLDLFKFGKD